MAEVNEPRSGTTSLQHSRAILRSRCRVSRSPVGPRLYLACRTCLEGEQMSIFP